jgi:hypothetical protein
MREMRKLSEYYRFRVSITINWVKMKKTFKIYIYKRLR